MKANAAFLEQFAQVA